MVTQINKKIGNKYIILLGLLLIQLIIHSKVYYYLEAFNQDINLVDNVVSIRFTDEITNTVGLYNIPTLKAEELIDTIKNTKNRRVKNDYDFILRDGNIILAPVILQ